ncbi:hypothetical protein [Curtobacterium sp. MCPF17_052]|uniref:hypothetical protein n=1 Tax=Curtobacterium sp. MCPF17_052 TaxID=2175655 RepID=UPI003463F7AF
MSSDAQQASGDAQQGSAEQHTSLATPAPETVLPATTTGVHTRSTRAESAPAQPAAAVAEQPAAEVAPKERPAGRRRVSSSAPVTPADTTVAILDIPVGVAKREPRRVSEEAAESLLDSVLQALPEPKQPGQGRARSRRVSSGSISAPANPTATEDDGTVILGQ